MSTSKLASALNEQFDNPWEEQFEGGWDVHFEKGWDAALLAAFEIIEQELGRTGNEYMLARLKSRFMRELEMKED